MTDTTHGGLNLRWHTAWRRFFELLASMRFAIALLTVICIASVIGTVMQQHEPVNNYVNQFGPFWAALFMALKLNAVYSAWWFLLILAFLVVSTSLCIARHAPKYLADIRNFKENIREKNLLSFGLKAQQTLAGEAPVDAAQRIGKLLVARGWKVKLQERKGATGTGWMVAAMAGSANKLGYIAAHSAIVLICLGGLLDGDLMVRAQMWFGGKTPYAGSGLISEVKPEHRLSVANPTFRGDLVVTEGTQASMAILRQSDGVLLQQLPFSIELKKFTVEHYSTGMPKLFASDVVIHDLVTGESTPQRIEVNHPVNYKGVEIYQSSFDDGGSQLRLRARSLRPGNGDFDVGGVVGGSAQLDAAQVGQDMALEFSALRVINVENMGDDGGGSGADVRRVDLRGAIESRLGAGNKTTSNRELRNVGPSVGYKLRDASGQAREFNNYMLPVDLQDGQSPVYLMGVRESQSEPFRYLRVPVDREGGMDDFLRMRRALLDPALRMQAVQRYARQAVDPARTELVEQLTDSAQRALVLFAGGVSSDGRPEGGLKAISDFIEANVPEAERERAGEVLIRILNGSLFELAQMTREQAGLAPLPSDAQTLSFMTQAVLALSDAQFYPAPAVFTLQDFNQIQASVFQVARAPGKLVVYLGCFFLIVGVFAMLYVRQRRVWVWLAPQDGGARATMALSSNRKTLDAGREFAQLRDAFFGSSPDGGTQ
ncbi:cytochrome c biogenesis protein ResB [Comamonas faecalis]|uniref:Cytochrome c biogenesis protein ResB n=1 Tax=Comamonas faecalis TaxID=1387849 RepID=A0ABP7RSD0_9BURK